MRRLIRAELAVLKRRPTAIAMLWVAVILPAVVVFIFGMLEDSEAMLNGKPIRSIIQFSGPDAAQLALRARHFFVMPLFLLTLAGQSLAGERVTHVMREQLVRPVSRDQMFLAKFLSLWTLSALTLALGAGVSLIIATPWLGMDGPWGLFFASLGLSVLTDLGILAVGFFLSSMLRSTAAVVIAGLMVLGLDLAMRLGMAGLGFLGVEGAGTISQLMLGSGLNVWSSVGDDWNITALIAIIFWSTFMLAVGRFRYSRLDIH